MTGQARPARCRLYRLALAILAFAALGCSDNRTRPTTPTFGGLVVRSDPDGAEAILDGVPLGTTPVTLNDLPTGPHDLDLELTASPAESFSWSGVVNVRDDATDTLEVALEGGCGFNCPFLMDRGRIRCRSTGLGDTCASAFFDAAALQWPGSNGPDYGSGGRLLVAAILDDDAGQLAGDTVASRLYDLTWLGRAPTEELQGPRLKLTEHEYWGTGSAPGVAVQGLSVKQTLLAVDSAAVEDVLFVHFEIENASGDARYRMHYPWIPEGGYTFRDLYIGFSLDIDVGAATDDLGSFDPDVDLSFIYDADFRDEELGSFSDRPALVGCVGVEPPEGATERTLTLWRASDDWDGEGRDGFAWRLLAGRLQAGDGLPDHPSPDIGYVSDEPDDYRFIDAHGPLNLAPGETATLTVAIVLADPAPGTFVPGTHMPAGDPTDPGRPIIAVAANLRALAALTPELWARYRP